ncbi:hypothetical protein MQY53_003097 [Salmonella enterica subsp. enterica]|nr:hypothetical protein [Salmonella enterica subsp. enterica]
MNNPVFSPVDIADIFCKKYPGAMAKIERARQMKGREFPDWPYWCFLPMPIWTTLLINREPDKYPPVSQEQKEILKLSVLGTWRYSKGVYTLHPVLLRALTETTLSDVLPVDVLLRLPEWCVYIRTPGITMKGEALHGFWATINDDTSGNSNKKSLYLLLNRQSGTEMEYLSLKPGSVSTLLNERFDHNAARHMDAGLVGKLKKSEPFVAFMKGETENLSKLLSILLYLCSDEPEIDSERYPGTYPVRPKPVKTKKGFRLFPASGPRYWSVGEKTGRILAEAEAIMIGDETTGITDSGRHVRAHLRRGHWHGFWSGKRDGSEDQKFSYHWLPPQIIGGRYS